MKALREGDSNSYGKILLHIKDDTLIDFLKSNPENQKARRLALSVLSRRRSTKARSLFAKLLESGNKKDAYIAAEYYCEVPCLCEKGIKGLKDVVNGDKYSLFARSYAALALSQAKGFDTTDIIPAIKRLLKSVPEYHVTLRDAHDCSYLLKYALAACGVPKYRNGIIDAIRNGNELALYKGIIGLGYMGDLSYVSLIALYLENNNRPHVTVKHEYTTDGGQKKIVSNTKIAGGRFSSAAAKALSLLINTDFSWKDRAISDGSLKKWKLWWRMNKDKEIYHRTEEIVPLVPKVLMDSSGYPLKGKPDTGSTQDSDSEDKKKE